MSSAWVRKSRYWRETFQFPHPLLWRNEASLLVHWRTLYFPLALWTLVCVHHVLSAHRPVLLCAQNTYLRRHTAVVDSSSGRSYVTGQWHNVPLLRTRGLVTQASIFITHCILWNTLPGPHKTCPRAASGPRVEDPWPTVLLFLSQHGFKYIVEGFAKTHSQRCLRNASSGIILFLMNW